MRPGFRSFFLQAIVLSSCVTAKPVPEDPFKIIPEMLDSGRFAEAETYLKTHMFMNKDTLQQMTARTKICGPIYDRCSQPQTSFLDARACIHDLRFNACDRYLSPKYKPMSPQTAFRLEEWDRKLRVPASISELCKDGEKWGYLRYSCSPCVSIRYSDLTGAFPSRDLCEEQRLLAKGSTSRQCYARYLGPQKNITHWNAKALVYIYENEAHGLDLKFLSRETCERALKDGLTYYNQGYAKHDIGPAGSSARSRFIGKCEKKATPYCRNAEEIDDLVTEEFIP